MRTFLISLLTVVGVMIAMPASAQRLHIDTPIGDLHVGQSRDGYNDHNYERPSYRSYGHDRYGHDRSRHQRNCRQIEYHDHHGNHRVRMVCD